MTVVLASKSPRRRQLLEMLCVENLRIVPATGEEKVPQNAGPEEIVRTLSEAKACEISERLAAENDRPDIIISADTIVWLDGKLLGKPHNEREAADMLSSLSGKTHEVYTGLCVICEDRIVSECERTEVCFRELSTDEIDAYIRTGEPMDKAGAYGIQGKGSLLVEHINGDFFNVMGLPVCRLGRILKEQGVRLI